MIFSIIFIQYSYPSDSSKAQYHGFEVGPFIHRACFFRPLVLVSWYRLFLVWGGSGLGVSWRGDAAVVWLQVELALYHCCCCLGGLRSSELEVGMRIGGGVRFLLEKWIVEYCFF
jgi:hypothetical protein